MYAVGETTEAGLNITYNYIGGFFRMTGYILAFVSGLIVGVGVLCVVACKYGKKK